MNEENNTTGEKQPAEAGTPENLAMQMGGKTNDQLLAMFQRPGDWLPAALDAAEAELQQRGVEACVAPVCSPPKPEGQDNGETQYVTALEGAGMVFAAGAWLRAIIIERIGGRISVATFWWLIAVVSVCGFIVGLSN